jgi:hypothetical protein
MRKQFRLSLVFVVLSLAVWGSLAGVAAQGAAQEAETPAGVVKQFYEHLKAKRYVEGFRLSVYRPAVEGLSAEEMRDLAPEFERMAVALPEKVETSGEQISGETATVFIKLAAVAQPQEVGLVRVEGQWRVGDRETYDLVKRQGRAFFLNTRLRVAEAETNEWLLEILGAELIHFKAKQRYTTLEELVKLGGVSRQFVANTNYRFDLKVSEDGRGFSVTAVPAAYGRTGKLSFYADQDSVVRAEDKAGQPATAASPAYAPAKE